MNFIRKKLFIISYIGNLLLIVAMFIPLIKFNNQTFAFIDQYFYLSFSIIVLVTISLVLIVMKKYKLSLIPTVINVALIVYGIVNILNIEGLKQTSDLTFGSAFILYPISILLILIGNLLVTSNKNSKIKNKEKNDEINPIDVKIEEPNEIENNDIELNFDEQIPLSQIIERTQNNISNNYNDDLTNNSKPNVVDNNPIGDFVELNDATIDKSDNDNSISINDNASDQLNSNLNNDFVNNSKPNVVNHNPIGDFVELNDVTIDKLDDDNSISINNNVSDQLNSNSNNDFVNHSELNDVNNNPVDDFVELNDVTIDKLDDDNSISINDNVSDQLNSNPNNDFVNDFELNDVNNNPVDDFVELNGVTIDKLDNDNSISINDNVSDQLNSNPNDDFVNHSELSDVNNNPVDDFVELNNITIDKLDNDDILMDDLDEVSNQPSLEKYNIKNEDLEIPDQSDDNNIMINNIQIEDKPKQEFMAINPFDIKVDEKKPLFKKNEKMEEDPIQKLMKRNIPMTLGRTCQFCNTPLGDDERICPICGRIN